MSLTQLYRDLILEHARDPGLNQDLDDANIRHEAFNPLCGDRMELSLALAEDVIDKMGLRVRGCAMMCASASIMRTQVVGLPLQQALDLGQQFLHCFAEDEPMTGVADQLQALLALRVQQARHKCVTLPWEALTACSAET